eukprot:12746820-Alexandrium_andersonii.AAC.1
MAPRPLNRSQTFSARRRTRKFGPNRCALAQHLTTASDRCGGISTLEATASWSCRQLRVRISPMACHMTPVPSKSGRATEARPCVSIASGGLVAAGGEDKGGGAVRARAGAAAA